MTQSNLLLSLLSDIYGSETALPLLEELRALIEHSRQLSTPQLNRRLTEADAMLISYGDQLRQPGSAPLASLAEFCSQQLAGLITCLHILPFYPSSSDDGFAVQDFRQVDPGLGSWAEIANLGNDFRLMFDAVINHVSAQGQWFGAYQHGQTPYKDFFITITGSPDLSQVVRPRALPLLTDFSGQQLWTTFSADQVDLNYANPQVLLEVLDLLLFYAARGAEFLRLDAVAYLWKQPGTSCINLPQTHRLIQVFRAVLDEAAPQVRLITETNIPHADNVAYFGDGSHEAQLVYNFALPPLLLHTLHTADAGPLSAWAASLSLPSKQVTFFNFLASHDGIGLNPLRGILPDNAIAALVERSLAHGGRVSYKQNPDGSQSPYELNINYFDALSDRRTGEPLKLQVARFMVAQAVLLALQGLPGIYFHSLFGSRGWPQAPDLTGSNRSINRQKLARYDLEQELQEQGSLRQLVFERFEELLRARRSHPAFDPYGSQAILDCGPAIFGILRGSLANGVVCLQNISIESQRLALEEVLPPGSRLTNLLNGVRQPVGAVLRLGPYQVLWLAIEA